MIKMPKPPKPAEGKTPPPPPKKKRRKRSPLLFILLLLIIAAVIALLVLGEGLGFGKGSGKSDSETSSSDTVEKNVTEEAETAPAVLNAEIKVSGSTIIYDGKEVTADEAAEAIKTIEGDVVVVVKDDNATQNAMSSLLDALDRAEITYAVSSSSTGDGGAVLLDEN